MIVRISGEGQYELDNAAVHKLDELDTRLTETLNAGNTDEFHSALNETIAFVRGTGTPLPPDQVKPSEVIIPPGDVTLEEARNFFTDDGLMAPLPA
jgi:hypothetical protein